MLDGDSLRRASRVDGLGVHEQIQSVRWLGDLEIIVTFPATDPLYSVDLSVPAKRRVVGALRIRGFSSYLHPIGRNMLLRLGQDATNRGISLGAQAAVFDLRIAAVMYADSGRISLVTLHVGKRGSLSQTSSRLLGRSRHSDVRTLPLAGNRIAVVSGGKVVLIDL